jgi:hypothetical protein
MPLQTATMAAQSRGWWDVISTLMVMLMASFWEALPHLIQLGGLIVVVLTGTEKLIALGWIKNPSRKSRKDRDDKPC